MRARKQQVIFSYLGHSWSLTPAPSRRMAIVAPVLTAVERETLGAKNPALGAVSAKRLPALTA